MDVAQKIVEAYFDKKMRKVKKRLEKTAQELGVDPGELIKFCEPLIKSAWQKHFPS